MANFEYLGLHEVMFKKALPYFLNCMSKEGSFGERFVILLGGLYLATLTALFVGVNIITLIIFIAFAVVFLTFVILFGIVAISQELRHG